MADPVRMYGLLAWTWIRAAAQYPVSMVLLALATAIVSVLDAAAILVLFSRAPRIAGFGVSEVLFLYGTSALAFACSDIALGTTERLGHHVREGTLDAMLVRPVSPLVQLATEGFTPRRPASWSRRCWSSASRCPGWTSPGRRAGRR